MRYVDDYLFITTELRNGRRFLSMMNQGAARRPVDSEPTSST